MRLGPVARGSVPYLLGLAVLVFAAHAAVSAVDKSRGAGVQAEPPALQSVNRSGKGNRLDIEQRRSVAPSTPGPEIRLGCEQPFSSIVKANLPWIAGRCLS
jgi:hypothetical protein